jgi:hypothetical protein
MCFQHRGLGGFMDCTDFLKCYNLNNSRPELRHTLNLNLTFELALDTSDKSTVYTERIFLPIPNPSLEKMEGNDLALANKRLNTSPEPRNTLNLSLILEFELKFELDSFKLYMQWPILCSC